MSAEDELALKALNDKLLLDCLARIRWRLKPFACRRLLIDIAALCTGLRNVVMVDYAWEASGLQNQLSLLLSLLAQEINLICCLEIMCTMDAVYIVHPKNLMNYMDATVNQTVKVEFIILDDVLPRIATTIEKNETLTHFSNFQEHLIPHLLYAETLHGLLTDVAQETKCGVNALQQSVCNANKSPTFKCINLGDISSKNEAPLPAINGWLLGYPVIYMFKKENVSKAVHSLSVSSLCRYVLSAQSEFTMYQPTKGSDGKAVHELLSFTVPSELSSSEGNQGLISSFFASMQNKVKGSNVWKSLTMDVTFHIHQSVAL